MKRILIASAIAAVATVVTMPAFAADVGVSINIGEPGFYGQIDVGGYPQPQVIYRQPIVVERVPVDRPPIYLRVPPGYAKHWSKHCREYNACGERVFFVQDNWYSHQYAPRYHEQHRERHEERRDDHHEYHEGDRHDDHDHDHDH